MHAKMTRDRKKNFISTIEKTIDDLASSNARMKEVLARVVQTHFKGSSAEESLASKASMDAKSTRVSDSEVPCPVTPESTSIVAPSHEIPPLDGEQVLGEMAPSKKPRHGYTLSLA